MQLCRIWSAKQNEGNTINCYFGAIKIYAYEENMDRYIAGDGDGKSGAA